MESKGNAIEENNALMNGQRKPIEEAETFRQFLFNRQNGTVLGRTAKSWAQITIFYIIFYSLLAAFWIACLAVFLNTLDDKVPRFYGKGTIIGVNPGLGYQPWIKENPDSTLIKFNIQDPSSYEVYSKALDAYFEKYSNSNDTRDCKGKGSNAEEPPEGSDEELEACRFSLDYFEQNQCGKSTAYGFKIGKPCIVLSLNRLIGWRPTDFPAGSVPEEIRGRYKPGNIALYCDGTNLPDKEHVGKLTYLPESGIDGKYYPYRVMKNYHQPVALVRFDNLPRNQLVLVECRAFALNIEHDITSRLGLVHFEILLENKKPEEKKAESR